MSTPPRSGPAKGGASRGSIWAAALVLLVVCLLVFAKAITPGVVVFSNDGPLAGLIAEQASVPEWFSGGWQNLNWLGANIGVRDVSITSLFLWVVGPVGFAKFYTPFTLFLLGLGAAYAFRRLGLSQWACGLGALAAALVSDFFSTAAWGLGSQNICFALNFCALGLLARPQERGRWLRIPLAGLAVGMGVIEGADIGALFSLLTATYVACQAWAAEGTTGSRIGSGFVRLIAVSGFAGFIAFNTVTGLVGTQIAGIAGTEQDIQTKEQRWDWATQWSLPKKEAIGIIVPGLFGYRMDSPDGGQYWGSIGQTPGWEQHHQGFPRYSGSGYYLGTATIGLALFAVVLGWRKRNSVFDAQHSWQIRFWFFVAVVCLLFAFGRHAPFYQLLYALPYFSTIRNPTKFLHLFTMAMVILFAFGVDGLWKMYLSSNRPSNPLKGWWQRCAKFEQSWLKACGIILGVGVLGWLLYASSRVTLERHLASVGFDVSLAQATAGFSIRQIGWFIMFLAFLIVIKALVFGGVLTGARSKWVGLLLGVVLVGDLVRANQPWIIYWDYQYKYATNPVIDFLREKPYTQRVAGLPDWIFRAYRLPDQLGSQQQYLEQMYRIEWMQQHFQYYNIQSLDIVQMSREPVDLKAYESALRFNGDPKLLPLVARRWELTNTRYLLGTSPLVELLNSQFDPQQQRFRVLKQFNLVAKPGVSRPSQLQDLTAEFSTNGTYAIFEFTGALPRVKLYSRWEASTNDQATLTKLASPDFNPHESVLVASPLNETPGTNQLPGTVEVSHYSPKQFELKADVKSPAILLVNDRYDPNWRVEVDGKTASLLRCNYIMRGVYLTPGQHTVKFQFRPPVRTLYVALAAMGVGIALILALIVMGCSERPKNAGLGLPT
jgi:hypothetical protein